VVVVFFHHFSLCVLLGHHRLDECYFLVEQMHVASLHALCLAQLPHEALQFCVYSSLLLLGMMALAVERVHHELQFLIH
jgi:hypothetical protein